MSARKSQYLSAFGKAFEIFKALIDALLDIGGNDEDLARILTDANLRSDLAQRILESRNTTKGKGKTLPITVLSDDEISSSGRTRAGRYDNMFGWPNGISGDYKCETPKTTRVEIELITLEKIDHPHGQQGKRSAAEQIANRGYRSANLSEMLSLGATYPKEQLKYTVATTEVLADYNSCQKDGILVLSATSDGKQRGLRIYYVNNFTFGGETRFAVVKVRK